MFVSHPLPPSSAPLGADHRAGDERSGHERSMAEAMDPPHLAPSEARHRARRRSLARTSLVLGLLLLSFLLLVGVVLVEVRTDEAVERVHRVQAAQDRVLGALTDVAIAQRDYLLTRDPSHRDRYGKKAGEAQALLGEAERRAADDPEWQARAAELRPAVQAALDEFALTLRLADAEGVGTAVEQ